MKKMILTLLTISMLLCTACAEQIPENINILPTAEKPAENDLTPNIAIPIAETSAEVPDGLPFTVSPQAGLEFASMYPPEYFSYKDITEEDVDTVNAYYESLQMQFYSIYIAMLNSGKYNKVYDSLYDRTENIYRKYVKSSEHPNFDEYYYSYTYNPIYEFLKEEAFEYDSPSYITPILLSDKFFEYMINDSSFSSCANGYGLQVYQYSNGDDSIGNQRLGTSDPYSVNISSYHAYESQYAIKNAVSGAMKDCYFATSDEENLSYAYIIDDNTDFLNIYAIYLKFDVNGTLYAVGLDYCSWAKNFFMNADILGKGLDHMPGVISTDDVFVKNGFMDVKNNLTKFLNSSLSNSTALNENNLHSTFDYKVYYTTAKEAMHSTSMYDQYYHITAWYSLE